MAIISGGTITPGASGEMDPSLGTDGSLMMRAQAGAPVNGVGGSFAGQAGPGCLLIDTTGTKLYINTGTKASPTWTSVGSQV